jgi:hypothetical protein
MLIETNRIDGAVLMSKKLSRIEREIRDHPEKFDYADIPPDYKLTPAQKARYDAMRPQWAKDLAGNKRP